MMPSTYDPDEEFFPAEAATVATVRDQPIVLNEPVVGQSFVLMDAEVHQIQPSSTPVVGHTGFEALTPAGRVAVLKALGAAVDARVKWEQSRIVENLEGATESRPLATPFGNLSFQPGKRPVKIDQDALMAYVKEHMPESVQTVVTEVIDPDVVKALTADAIHVGDGLFASGTTGEAIDYAYLGDFVDGQVSWPASKQQRQTKAQAERVLNDHLDGLTVPMLEEARSE